MGIDLLSSLKESTVQFRSSVLSDSLRPAAHQASLSINNSQSLLKLVSIKSVMLSNHLILCRPLLLLSSIFPSIRVFSSESVLGIRWPEYWSFSFSIRPSNEYSVLVSFRIDWFCTGLFFAQNGSPSVEKMRKGFASEVMTKCTKTAQESVC